ncbi:preprotein translocase subunit SecG [candidate division CSSED10-310 bacterium]|uniref:Protein-export membrane protein SecG n=1 Tax=candidate division CSSED10-310 bacterium TaxID=2855610 RepID=A0ABV6YYV7_UNCC1
MVTFVSFIHVVMSLILIIIVLLQTGKGTDLASAFGGGGSQTLFGSHGAASFLNKLTTVAAIMYMVTSLTLAILSAAPEKSLMEEVDVQPEQTETTTETGPADTTNIPPDQGTVPEGSTPAEETVISEEERAPVDQDVTPAQDPAESSPDVGTHSEDNDSSAPPPTDTSEESETSENSDS